MENWNQNYANYEQKKRQEMEKSFEIEKANLIAEKEKALSEMKQYYEFSMVGMKEKAEQNLSDLKEKYENGFYEKSSRLDERIMELTEEHDNQLHNLRLEMEQELIAERRKSVAENEDKTNEIQRLQKECRQMKSDVELKNLKIVNLELGSTNDTEELQKLRRDNKELRWNNNNLQALWDNQGPEMEAQRQQIASLQQLNQQLSEYVHEGPSQSSVQKGFKLDPADKVSSPLNPSVPSDNSQETRDREQSNVNELLKDIHIHSPL